MPVVGSSGRVMTTVWAGSVPAVMFTEIVAGTGAKIGTIGRLREKPIEVPIAPADGMMENAPDGTPGVMTVAVNVPKPVVVLVPI